MASEIKVDTISQKTGSGDLTVDVAGDIILDADGANVTIKDGGTAIGDFSNSSSDFVIESKVSDKDIIFKVNDGGSATEVARFDGDVSALKMASGKKLMLGAAEETLSGDGTDITFEVGSSGDINVPANIGLTFGDDGEKIEGDGTDLTISGNNINLTATADVVIPNNVGIQFGGASEKIEGDGTDMTISANNLTVDAAADITLDAAGNNFKFSSGGTQILDIANSSSNIIIKPTVDAKDIIFQQYDGNEVMRINDSRKLQFYDDGGESITSDGSKLIIESGGTTFNLPTSDGSSGQAITTNGSGTLSFADAGGGKVLQVVSTFSQSASSTSTVDSNVFWLNASITPASSSNKVLVLGMLTVSQHSNNNRCGGVLKRGSTVIEGTYGEHDDFFNGTYHEMDGNNSTATTLPFVYLDSPSTTSSTTYYLGTRQNANTTYFNRARGTSAGYTSTITLLEIGA
jgi:hypothetical protein